MIDGAAGPARSPRETGAAASRSDVPAAGVRESDSDAARTAAGRTPLRSLLPYLLLGIYFGVVLMKSEVVSWFRIQEMFRFQSFHMYGIIGSAVLVAGAGVHLIRRLGLTSVSGEPIRVPPKRLGRGIRYGVGGTLFGVGWALTGACPGPLFALFGSGITAIGVAIAAAILGTWTYGMLRPRLPHY